MNLISVCINHHTAPVDAREALFLQEEEIRNFINEIKGKLLNEGLVISTCNRTEIYGLPANQNINSQTVQDFLLQYKAKQTFNTEYFQHFFSRPALRTSFQRSGRNRFYANRR